MSCVTAHRITLSAAPSSAMVATSRRRVADALSEWGWSSASALAYSVRLVASELISNAVCHAGSVTPVIIVELQADSDGGIRLAVFDEHPAEPLVSVADETNTSGRGLAIVQSVVAEHGGRMGYDRHDSGGKTVWAEFPAQTPNDAPVHVRVGAV